MPGPEEIDLQAEVLQPVPRGGRRGIGGGPVSRTDRQGGLESHQLMVSLKEPIIEPFIETYKECLREAWV